jgi:PAS domain-containing protein
VAVVSAVLSYVAADYFFIPPRYAIPLTNWNETSINALVAFIVVTGTILALAEVLNRSNRRSQAEAKRATEERERFKVTLASIGDAVIATRADECVAFMNGIAADLTGWEHKDAMGTPLRKVFHIINEKTRQVVENPCAKVIQTGASRSAILAPRRSRAEPLSRRIHDGPVLGRNETFRDQKFSPIPSDDPAGAKNVITTGLAGSPIGLAKRTSTNRPELRTRVVPAAWGG